MGGADGSIRPVLLSGCLTDANAAFSCNREAGGGEEASSGSSQKPPQAPLGVVNMPLWSPGGSVASLAAGGRCGTSSCSRESRLISAPTQRDHSLALRSCDQHPEQALGRRVLPSDLLGPMSEELFRPAETSWSFRTERVTLNVDGSSTFTPFLQSRKNQC